MRLPGEHGVTVAADLTGGTVECVQLTDNGFRKLRLTLRRSEVVVEMSLSPAEAADFAVELQRVLDWLAE